MSFDPKVCRKHSVRCAEMARTARTPQLKQTLSELAQSWGKLAVQIERNLALRDEPLPPPRSGSDLAVAGTVRRRSVRPDRG